MAMNTFNPSKPSGVKWLHFKTFSAVLVYNPPFLFFLHLGTLALSPECQSAQMSKKLKGRLDQYGAICYGRLIFATVRKSVGLKVLNLTI